MLESMKAQLLSLKIDTIENLLHDLHKAGMKLPLNVENFFKKLRKDVHNKSRIQSKEPAMFVHHKLQEASIKPIYDNTSVENGHLHPLQRMKLQHYREVLKYL